MSNRQNRNTVKNAINLFCKWSEHKTLIVDGNDRCTGARLNNEARRIAQGLAEHGIGKGDTVALMGVASSRFFAAYFAVQKLGGVTCNIHVRESSSFIAQTLTQLNAKAVICNGKLLATTQSAVAMLDATCPIFTLESPQDGKPTADYSDMLERYPATEPDAEVAASDDAVIILSSGSTGTPKGIVHTNGNFVGWMKAAPVLFGAVSRSTRFLVNVGTSFAAWPFSAVPILYAGGTIILMEGFTPEGFCQAVEKERVTMAGPVPTMIRMLTPDITQRYDLSSFEMVLCAGEPPTLSDIERVLTWADTDVRCLYLASESAPGASTYWELSDHQRENKPVCAGKPIGGADLRVVDPAGGLDDELPVGEVGEILLRGPTLARGYLNNEPLTQEKFVGGWWRSGDMGHLDEDGYVFVEGRTDNMINTGGIKVQGEEVESYLIRHESVSQAAVIGVPDPKWGQRVEAHLATSELVSEDQLREYCREEGLAPFKIPKSFVFHDALPVGVTGKLDRVSLRKPAEK